MRLRVLLSAFAFEPNRGYEPGVGWNVATRLAQHHDVTVICGDLKRRQTLPNPNSKNFSELTGQSQT